MDREGEWLELSVQVDLEAVEAVSELFARYGRPRTGSPWSETSPSPSPCAPTSTGPPGRRRRWGRYREP